LSIGRNTGAPGCKLPRSTHALTAAHAAGISAHGTTTSTAAACDPFERLSVTSRPRSSMRK
jgi:hypothetical protein